MNTIKRRGFIGAVLAFLGFGKVASANVVEWIVDFDWDKLNRKPLAYFNYTCTPMYRLCDGSLAGYRRSGSFKLNPGFEIADYLYMGDGKAPLAIPQSLAQALGVPAGFERQRGEIVHDAFENSYSFAFDDVRVS